jgi:hypothetical protein
MLILGKLLGPIMGRLYGNRDLEGEDIVPNALGFPLQAALIKLDPAHLTIEEPAKEVITANATKTRIGLQKKKKMKQRK